MRHRHRRTAQGGQMVRPQLDFRPHINIVWENELIASLVLVCALVANPALDHRPEKFDASIAVAPKPAIRTIRAQLA